MDDEQGPAPAGPLSNVGAALAVVALGLAGVAGSWSLGLGTPARPEPGMWPLIVSAGITVLGVSLLFQVRRTADTEVFTRSSLSVLAGLATMVVFVALIGVIGFEIPSALLAVFWLRFLGGESWRLSVLTGIGIVVAFYAIFVGALGVPVPHLF